MGADGPTFVLLEEEVVALTEAWFQQVIDREVEGVELVLLEEAGSRRQKILRLYIDHPGGVTHELCAGCRRRWARLWTRADAFEGPYTLEVSSPGIERPLRKRSHFEAQVGKKVYVKTRAPVEGSKVWQGILREVDAEDIVVSKRRGARRGSRWARSASAHLIYEFR